MSDIPKFVMNRADEETLVFFVNGTEVGRVTEQGSTWAGMEEAEALFESITTELGAIVEVEDIEEPLYE